MFETAELGGLDKAGDKAATGAEDPGAGQAPEGEKAGLGKAGLEGGQQLGEGIQQQIGHGEESPGSGGMKSFTCTYEREGSQKNGAWHPRRREAGSAPLPFLQ